jgi:hypothetical protein
MFIAFGPHGDCEGFARFRSFCVLAYCVELGTRASLTDGRAHSVAANVRRRRGCWVAMVEPGGGRVRRER